MANEPTPYYFELDNFFRVEFKDLVFNPWMDYTTPLEKEWLKTFFDLPLLLENWQEQLRNEVDGVQAGELSKRTLDTDQRDQAKQYLLHHVEIFLNTLKESPAGIKQVKPSLLNKMRWLTQETESITSQYLSPAIIDENKKYQKPSLPLEFVKFNGEYPGWNNLTKRLFHINAALGNPETQKIINISDGMVKAPHFALYHAVNPQQNPNLITQKELSIIYDAAKKPELNPLAIAGSRLINVLKAQQCLSLVKTTTQTNLAHLGLWKTGSRHQNFAQEAWVLWQKDQAINFNIAQLDLKLPIQSLKTPKSKPTQTLSRNQMVRQHITEFQNGRWQSLKLHLNPHLEYSVASASNHLPKTEQYQSVFEPIVQTLAEAAEDYKTWQALSQNHYNFIDPILQEDARVIDSLMQFTKNILLQGNYILNHGDENSSVKLTAIEPLDLYLTPRSTPILIKTILRLAKFSEIVLHDLDWQDRSKEAARYTQNIDAVINAIYEKCRFVPAQWPHNETPNKPLEYESNYNTTAHLRDFLIICTFDVFRDNLEHYDTNQKTLSKILAQSKNFYGQGNENFYHYLGPIFNRDKPKIDISRTQIKEREALMSLWLHHLLAKQQSLNPPYSATLADIKPAHRAILKPVSQKSRI